MKYILVMFYYLNATDVIPAQVVEVASFKTELDCYSEGLYYSAKYNTSEHKSDWLCIKQ